MQSCKVCDNSGHDSNSRPEFHFEPFIDKGGKKRKQFVTDKRGSGCLKCQGRGYHE